MLKIRLTRTGKTGQPHYRIILKEERDRRDGKYTALLGSYQPLAHPPIIKLNKTAYQSWLAKGAQPSATVRALARKAP